MLTQFRILYPQGSLISELITIDHGKYIVRVIVQSQGVMIATGLAAAHSIEEAEDNARNRALSILDLDATVAPQSTVPNTKISEVEVEKKPKSHKQESAKSAKSDRTHVPVVQETLEPTQVKPLLLEVTATPNHKDETLPEPELISNKITSSTTESAIESDVVDEPLPLVLQETSPESEIILSVEDNISVQSPSKEAVNEEPSFEEPLENKLTKELSLKESLENELTEQSSVQESLTSTATEPIDFSDVIAKSNFELKRLGWTNEQGRNYLLETYGKRSRQLLSDEELLEFLHYLEGQPTQ